MVDVDVFIEVESSNGAGFLALLDEVPIGDMTRWIGAGGIHPPIPSTPAQRPYEVRIPGARMFTPRRPYSNNVSRVITAVGAATVDYASGGSPSASAKQDTWVYIRTNSTGQGNFRKLNALAGATQATASAPWSPALAADGTIHFLLDSHTSAPRTLATFDSTTGITGGATDTITISTHGLASGTKITFSGTLAANGLLDNTTYFVLNPTTNTFQVSRTLGGPAVDLTPSGASAITTFAYESTTTVVNKSSNTDALTTPTAQDKFVLFLGKTQTFTVLAKLDVSTVTPGTDVFDFGAAHNMESGDPVQLTTTGAMPTYDDGAPPGDASLLAGVVYYVIKTGANTVKLAATLANAVAAVPVPFDIISAGSGTLTAHRPVKAPAHGLPANIKVRVVSTTTLPGGLAVETDYFLRDVQLDAFWLATSAGGAYIPFTSVGSGTHTFHSYDDTLNKVTAFTSTQITLERALSFAPTGGYGFCILTGANACETMADLTSTTKNALQDMTFYLDQNAPVFLTGLDYPNFDTTPFQSPRIAYGIENVTGPTMNLSNELQFHLRSRCPNLVIVKMAVSASMISPFLNGQVFAPTPNTAPFGAFTGWFHDIKSLDHSPASPNALHTALKNMLTGTAALIVAEGNTPRYRGLLIHCMDNDPADEQRTLRSGANLTGIRDAVRAHVGDPSMPCVLSGPDAYGGSDTNRERIYVMLKQVAASDKAGTTGVTDNRDNNNVSPVDGLHFNALGQILLAQTNFPTWDAIFTQLVEDTAASTSMAIEISNIALSYIGETAKVFSLDTAVDQSTQARICAQFYPVAFKHTREAHTWAFNTFTKALQVVNDPDPLRTDWAFSYLPPPDMDSPIRIKSPGMSTTSGEVPPWWRIPNAEGALLMKDDDPDYEIEIDYLGRRVIFCNVESAQLKYSARISSKTLVPHSFKEAVARKLAALISGPIRKDPDFTQKMEGLARIETGDAAAIDSNRQQKGPPPDRMPWNRG